jgi:tetratricopeptide (TPR) repeat protein
MKTTFLLFTLALLYSCSSSRIDRKITDSSWDTLADETYLRWGENRLSKANSDHKVVGCYKGEAKETLKQYKKDYITKNGDQYYWLHIGNCYFVQDAWSKAEFFYNMTVEEAKGPVEKSIALNNLGLIHFKYEQWEKGREYLREAMRLAPKFKVPRYNLSQLYLQFGFYDRAIELLTDSVFKGGHDIDVFFSLANAYLFKGDMATAEKYFKEIPRDYFQREDIAATYSLFLIKKGDLKGAKVMMDERSRSGVPEITAISSKIEKMISEKLKQE